MKIYLKKNKVRFAIAVFFAISYAFVNVGISLLLQHIVDTATSGEILKAILIAAGYMMVLAIICFLQARSEVGLNQRITGEIRNNIVEKILKKSTMDFEKHKSSDYVSLVQNDVKKIEDSYISTILSILCDVVMLVLAVIVMTRYSWVFTVFMFVMTAIMFVVPMLFSKKLSGASEELSKAQEKMTEGLTEVVGGFEVVRSLQKEDYSISKFGIVNKYLIKKGVKFGLLKQMNNSASNTLMFTMQMVICILAGYFIYIGKISYGSMVGVIQVSGSFCQPLFQLFALIPALKALEPIIKKIGEYTVESSETAGKESENQTGHEKKHVWSKITFENVSFAYPDSEKETLKSVNLSIEKGKKYLIVGESGAGKSTLINMLCGNYEPKAGKVLIDGASEKQNILKKLTAVVWQKVFLFNESIKENVMLGETNDAKYEKAIRNAEIEDVVKEKGADYKVGSDGSLLSGGQKQRVAIARAMYAERDIIVLDEGISALDNGTARAIEETLLDRQELTLISVSHHILPETRTRYDEIIELKNGTTIQKPVDKMEFAS
ncbi:MAG: ABC transporter ATP-binding protein [Lachnospiraceae bacterium]|nr:ABC transporter ATP-binding protein [Lachnospiraceae bacterium]